MSYTPLPYLLSTSQLTEGNHLEHLFARAAELEKNDLDGKLPHSLVGKILACLFYEPSTRTRFSFESAMQKLGGNILTAENAAGNSSSAKGETIEDTVRIVSGYADAIVIRHFEEGTAKKAVSASPVPVINAGDGSGEHPTQALLDVYTIQKELGTTDNLTIMLIGDLFYGRAAHSLLTLISEFKNVTVCLVSPDELKLPESYKAALAARNISFEEYAELDPVIGRTDVLYVTRVQKERFKSEEEYNRLKDVYVVNGETLKKMKSNSIILHPLPRVTEIATEVDADPRAAYFRQAKNGLYVRMALLESLILKK